MQTGAPPWRLAPAARGVVHTGCQVTGSAGMPSHNAVLPGSVSVASSGHLCVEPVEVGHKNSQQVSLMTAQTSQKHLQKASFT